MENCTIYSHQLNFEKVVEIIKNELPKAKIDYKYEGKQKSLTATLKGGFFSKTKTLKINYRERKTPSYKLDQIECGLTQNLAGMANMIQSLPAQKVELKNKFLAKVMSANCEMPFIAEPEINSEFESVLRKITNELDCFVFAQPSKLFDASTQQHFVDKNLNLVLDMEGNNIVDDIDVTVDAKYHDAPSENDTEEQKLRKATSEAFLESNGIKVNKNLPSTPSINDIQIRSKKEVIDRAYALLVIAVKGEGVEQEHLVKTVAEKNINSFSPKESMIYNKQTLDDQERANATWRYESLYTIIWALGLMEELKYPSDICDVTDVVGKIFEPSRAEFEAKVNLRSLSEILSELDKTYRMNWACVDARIKVETVSGGINPSVVYERHYSLNWLTNHQNQNWDDVTTNT